MHIYSFAVGLYIRLGCWIVPKYTPPLMQQCMMVPMVLCTVNHCTVYAKSTAYNTHQDSKAAEAADYHQPCEAAILVLVHRQHSMCTALLLNLLGALLCALPDCLVALRVRLLRPGSTGHNLQSACSCASTGSSSAAARNWLL